jgi:hypothetical protein
VPERCLLKKSMKKNPEKKLPKLSQNLKEKIG